MGFFGGICSFVSGAIGVLSSAVSTIGKGIVSYATKLIKEISPVIDAVIGIMKVIGESFGILKPEDDVEELGAKAMKSDKKVEDFDSVNEYIDHLRNEIELDKNEMKEMNDSKKLACKAVGATITSKGISEKVGMNIPVDFWIEVGKHSMKVNEVEGLIKTFKANNMSEVNFSSYLKGNMKFSERKETGKVIVEAYQEINPNMSIEEIEDQIISMASKQ